MRPAKTYGALGWATNRQGVPYWALDLEPHAAIKAKRVFPRIEGARTGLLPMKDTPEVAADLSWFVGRYPLKMTEETRQRLAARTAEHEEYLFNIEALLNGSGRTDYPRQPAREGRDYQMTAADLARLTGGLLLGDEVGLGKTQTALMMLREASDLPALIVVPTHLPQQWKREVAKVWPDLRSHIITKGSPVVRRVRKGARVEVPYDTEGADILIISYSKLAGWVDALAGRVKTVIFDEVQELRRTNSDKYTAAKEIADQADRRLGLSATPIYNYGGEAYNIYEVLAPGVLGNRYEFYREWGGSTRPNGDVVVADPAALGAHLRDLGLLLRRTRAEVGREIGEPIEVVMEIESHTSATEAVMQDVVSMAHKVLSGTREERFVAAGQIDMRMRQATGVDKAPFVAAFARMLLESERKIAIYGWHRDVYDIWLSLLSDLNPVMYTGSESPTQKAAAAERFINDPECRVFIGSLRSGAGLDGLQDVCSVVVFGELDWSPATHHQVIGRFARDGQENEVVAYYPLSDVGSDPVIGGVLEDKRQQSELLMTQGEGGLFTAQADTGNRAKSLAKAVLARAGQHVA